MSKIIFLFMLLFVSCVLPKNTRLKNNIPLYVGEHYERQYFLGYILSEPKKVWLVKSEISTGVPYWYYDEPFIEFDFLILDNYRNKTSKKIHDVNLLRIIKEDSMRIDTSILESNYHYNQLKMYVPIKYKSQLKRMKNCFYGANLLILEDLSISDFYYPSRGFTLDIYNFKTEYLDSLTPDVFYKIETKYKEIN